MAKQQHEVKTSNFPQPVINYTKRVLKAQRNNTSKVVSGQAMSLKAIAHKMQNGIPMNSTARQVESYYRNLDLVDQHNLADQAAIKASQLREQYNTHQQKLQQSREEDRKAFEQFKQQFQNGNTPTNTVDSPNP